MSNMSLMNSASRLLEVGGCVAEVASKRPMVSTGELNQNGLSQAAESPTLAKLESYNEVTVKTK